MGFRRYTLKDMQEIAASKGGKCLSKQYVNNNTHLRWECKEGHQWKSTPSSIRNLNTWCPKCAIKLNADKKRGNIQEMQEIAASKGGKCLSKQYVNSGTHLRWECKEGHQWKAKPNPIVLGSWCPKCATKLNADKKRGKIQEMQEIAASKGGKCLSKQYGNNQTHLRWECKEGHQWEAVPISIKNQSSWCPVCAGKHLSIKDMQKLAKKKGGKCLSKQYVNNKIPLRWKCNNNHEWEANPTNIQMGRWCPQCHNYSGESISKTWIETIFKMEFLKTKPKWLKNKKGNRMELDGYNPSLKIAFEYHGIQHYEYNNFFHKNRSLIDQIESDKLKRKLCKLNNIKLIEIPYIIKYEKIGSFIINQLEKKNIPFPPTSKKIKFNELDISIPSKFKKMILLAEKKGGRCLSKQYVNNKTPLRWACREKHQWEAVPSSIKNQGSWCPVCAGKHLSIKDMQKSAKKKGGKCLSKQYVSDKIHLRWECKEGHQWEAVPSSIKTGRWCPKCGTKSMIEKLKGNIQEMQEIAASKGGKCLSKQYVNSRTPLKWKCKKEHEWETTPHGIKSGCWCPVCARNVRLSIEDMQQLAKKKGGKCLSKQYVNNNTHLRWECKEGHQWEAIPSSIRNLNTWCPKCGTKSMIEKLRSNPY